MSLPTVAVVGFPNVGKSTLVNRLAGGREAVTHAEPGVTRDRKRVALRVERGRLRAARHRRHRPRRRRASWPATSSARRGSAMAEADVVLFVVDARAGLRAGDAELAKTLRGADVPGLVVANKVDRPERRTPRGRVLQARPRRAGRRLGDARPRQRRPARPGRRAARRAADGRRKPRTCRSRRGDRPPERRQVLARQRLPRRRAGDRLRSQAGTTRDAIDTELEVGGRRVILVDTAGLRRRSKVAGTVDYYAQLRSERAVERADVALVVCDASEGITAEDLRVAELAMRAGCATLLALNKWDVGRDRHRRRSRPGRPQAAPAPRGRHLLGARAAATSPTCCRRRWSWPIGPPSGSRRLS